MKVISRKIYLSIAGGKKGMEKSWNNYFSGPLLYNYVWWVLQEAYHRKLHRLYFLARDGYILREIAELFCQKYNLSISCRYLYCSRASLRMPSYHLIGEEAIELLTLGGYYVSPQSLLDRLQLTKEQRETIYKEIGLQNLNENEPLSNSELKRIRELLKNSGTYRHYIEMKSKEAYPSTIGYLKQEGLFDYSEIAIVDSGWTGSMQRSLRQILHAEGYTGRIVGFYFGMYAQPKESCDGEYVTWYFNRNRNLFHKILFCNNLFECILSAPHGMTISYCFRNGQYKPVLKNSYNEDQTHMIQKQIRDILSYTQVTLRCTDFWKFDKDKALQTTHQLVKRYMGHPKKQEVDLYGEFMFCDDITENYHMKLASPEQIDILKNYTIVKRIIKRIFDTSPYGENTNLFWPFGTIAYLPVWKRFFYRWNIYIWEFIKYVLR